MIIVMLPLAIFIALLICWYWLDWSDASVVMPLTIISGIVFIVIFIATGIIRESSNRAAEDYNEIAGLIQLTDSENNAALSACVRLVVASKIEEINSEIEVAKQYNGGILDVWLSDETATLDPIK